MAYDVSRALLSAYRNGIRHFQRLLKTHQTDVEQSYIKERLLSCKAAVTALNGFSRPTRTPPSPGSLDGPRS